MRLSNQISKRTRTKEDNIRNVCYSCPPFPQASKKCNKLDTRHPAGSTPSALRPLAWLQHDPCTASTAGHARPHKHKHAQLRVQKTNISSRPPTREFARQVLPHRHASSPVRPRSTTRSTCGTPQLTQPPCFSAVPTQEPQDAMLLLHLQIGRASCRER